MIQNRIAVRRKESPDSLLADITGAIMEVVNYVNVQKNMTDPQVEMTAKIIMNKYHIVDMDEIRAAFMNGCAGDFGPLYNCLDGTILTSWIDKYLASDDFTRKRKAEKAALPDEPKNVYETIVAAMDDEQRDLTYKALEQIEQKNKRVFYMGGGDHVKHHEINPFEQWCIDQFEMRYSQDPKYSSIPGHKWIDYKKKVMLFADFYDLKLKQFNKVHAYLTDRNATLQGHG